MLSLHSAFEDAGSQQPTGLPASPSRCFIKHIKLPKQEYYSVLQQLQSHYHTWIPAKAGCKDFHFGSPLEMPIKF